MGVNWCHTCNGVPVRRRGWPWARKTWTCPDCKLNPGRMTPPGPTPISQIRVQPSPPPPPPNRTVSEWSGETLDSKLARARWEGAMEQWSIDMGRRRAV